MWQRFTERARRIIFFAQEEAAILGESYVSTEHILLGMLREEDTVATRILDRMGMPPALVRYEIQRQVTRGAGRLGQEMQLTPRGQRVITLAYDEARQLNNRYIGTEHLLLGLIREADGLAGRVLAKLGVDLERTRHEVMLFQENDTDMPPPPTAESSTDFAKAFSEEFEKLSAEKRTGLTGEGVPMHQLPDTMQQILRGMVHQETTLPDPIRQILHNTKHRPFQNSSFVLDSEGIVRVDSTQVEGTTYYTVTTPTSFLMNLSAKDASEKASEGDPS